MATAVLRVPDPRVVPLPLPFVTPAGPQIFVHEGARQALERRFMAAFGGPVQLAVTDNRRRMVTHSCTKGTLQVRVHMMFLGAADRVRDALVAYVVRGDKEASQIVGEYIDQNLHRIRASRPVPGPLKTRGEVHDLVPILAEINAEYFGGALSDVLITWGRRSATRGGTRHSIKLGSYSAVERLVRINPVLDKPWVPRYFVAYIVYHELLHHVVPEVRSGGRTILHPPEFQRREREFRHFERAVAWEHKHIDRLLRSR
ncbi:MAG TPA: hypothetical protein VFQ61_10980 [Polyangiaceae bacterium]|nr:hypothetical protein [Polyangiaceae bacterium]